MTQYATFVGTPCSTTSAEPKSNWASPIERGPFRAYPVVGGITFTFGGVQVNRNAQVLNNAAQPIKGLFAHADAYQALKERAAGVASALGVKGGGIIKGWTKDNAIRDLHGGDGAETDAVKIEHEYHLLRGDEVLCEGHSTLACVDRAGNVCRVPEWLPGG